MKIISLQKHSDVRGDLIVLEKKLPFEIKRVFFIKKLDPSTSRGFHRHRSTRMLIMAVQGSFIMDCYFKDPKLNRSILLNKDDEAFLIEPDNYHIMKSFSHDCVIMVLASTEYDLKDYIYENYEY